MKKNHDLGLFPREWLQKILRMMRLTGFLCLICILHVSANVRSQNVRFDLNVHDATIEQALNKIAESTRLNFFYNNSKIDVYQKIDLNLENVSIEEALKEVFKGKEVKYEITDKFVVIHSVGEQKNSQLQQTEIVMIRGKVTDTAGNPLPGVSVVIDGTSFGVATNVDGKYEISIEKSYATALVFSFMGMKGQKVTIGSKREINVVMHEDVAEMDEVVVTGIFNKSRESYTGAVTTVTEKELKMYRGQNLLSTLKNIDPAFNVLSNNLKGSNPNYLPEVNIRGNSSLPLTVQELNEGASAQLNAPLVIMDGFEISLQKLMDFSDEEIQSINILKDASATAIYGSRGANGVIVVTTKAPQPGKLKIFVQGGINLELPDLSSYDLLNAAEKLALEKKVGYYDGETPDADRKAKEEYYEKLAEILRGVDTYWLKEPVRTGIGQRYNLRLEGGSNDFRWGTSLSYNNVTGAMKGSERNTFSGTINLAYYYKNVIFKNQINVDINKGVESNYGTFSDYVKMNPYWRLKDEKGEYIKSYRSIGKGFTIGNPLYDAQLNTVNEKKYTMLTNNFSIEWEIIEALRLRGQIGISKMDQRSDKFLPPTHSKFEAKKYQEQDGIARKGTYDYSTENDVNIDASINLSYSKTFNKKHQIYAGVDYSISQQKGENYDFQAEGFSSERLDFFTNALQYAEGTKPSGRESISRRIGITGNVNYTFDNRYYADFSYRVDGSSQFGTNNKFAPFWSAGIGWNIHNENFLKDHRVVNNLRIRGSYGKSGSQQFEPYQALSTFQYFVDDRYLMWNGAELMGLGNPNLKWQVTDQIDAGIEIGLFNNRVTASFDIYNKKTSNLLSQMDIPLAHGFDSYADNVGEVKNYGYEGSLTGYVIRNTEKEIMWTVTGKIAYNKDKITRLSQAIKNQTERYKANNTEINRLLYEGRSQNAIYAVPSLGIDPSTGKELFLDANGQITTKWNPSAKIYAGVSEPLYRGNVSTMFMYKNLTVNLSFGYHFGGQQYNETLKDKVEIPVSALQYNVDKRALTQRWLEVGDVKPYKGYYGQSTKMSTRFVMDDRVFELQSANIQYRLFSKYLMKHCNIQSMDFSWNMSNLFYISSIKRERGIEYPFARSMSFTFALRF